MNKGTAARAALAWSAATGAVAGAALALAGCHAPAAQRPPLEGARIGGPFVLTDQDGRPFESARLAGRYPLVYFGYTFCPDVCPTDLAAVGQAMRLLEKSDPAKAGKVQPIFVTVDPARDTPPVLKDYVRAFHPRLIGLTGTEAQVAAVAKKYAVVFRRDPRAPGAGGYLVDHSRMVTLFGPRGEPLALVPADQGGAASAKVLEQWVR